MTANKQIRLRGVPNIRVAITEVREPFQQTYYEHKYLNEFCEIIVEKAFGDNVAISFSGTGPCAVNYNDLVRAIYKVQGVLEKK